MAHLVGYHQVPDDIFYTISDGEVSNLSMLEASEDDDKENNGSDSNSDSVNLGAKRNNGVPKKRKKLYNNQSLDTTSEVETTNGSVATNVSCAVIYKYIVHFCIVFFLSSKVEDSVSGNAESRESSLSEDLRDPYIIAGLLDVVCIFWVLR